MFPSKKRWLKEHPLLLTEHFPPKKLQNGGHFGQTGSFPPKRWEHCCFPPKIWLKQRHFCWLNISLTNDKMTAASADWPFPSKRWRHLSPVAICATVSCSQTLSNCICISLIYLWGEENNANHSWTSMQISGREKQSIQRGIFELTALPYGEWDCPSYANPSL